MAQCTAKNIIGLGPPRTSVPTGSLFCLIKIKVHFSYNNTVFSFFILSTIFSPIFSFNCHFSIFVYILTISKQFRYALDFRHTMCYNISTSCAEGGDTMPETTANLIQDEMSQKIIDAVEEIAMEGGAATLTVTQILRKLDISNRVFYNRFPNIETVLDIVYRNTIVKIRSALESPIDIMEDFFEYVKDVVSRSLLVSYEVKMKFNQYIFEEDSLGELNRTWWTDEIKKLIIFAKEHKLIKDVDEETLAYSIWCFCRGYNADAVARGLPKEKAVADFKYSFSFLLEGLKI